MVFTKEARCKAYKKLMHSSKVNEGMKKYAKNFVEKNC